MSERSYHGIIIIIIIQDKHTYHVTFYLAISAEYSDGLLNRKIELFQLFLLKCRVKLTFL